MLVVLLAVGVGGGARFQRFRRGYRAPCGPDRGVHSGLFVVMFGYGAFVDVGQKQADLAILVYVGRPGGLLCGGHGVVCLCGGQFVPIGAGGGPLGVRGALLGPRRLQTDVGPTVGTTPTPDFGGHDAPNSTERIRGIASEWAAANGVNATLLELTEDESRARTACSLARAEYNTHIVVFDAIVHSREMYEQRLLNDLGRALEQGYYFSRPLPADQFEKTILKESAL